MEPPDIRRRRIFEVKQTGEEAVVASGYKILELMKFTVGTV